MGKPGTSSKGRRTVRREQFPAAIFVWFDGDADARFFVAQENIEDSEGGRAAVYRLDSVGRIEVGKTFVREGKHKP